MRKRRGPGFAAGVVAVVVSVATLLLAASSRAAQMVHTRAASNAATFSDPQSDSPSTTDITNVSIAVDDNGIVHFQISVPQSTTQANGGGMEVVIDSDLNGVADYIVKYNPGTNTPNLYKCPNTGSGSCPSVSEPSLQGSYSAGPSFQVSRAAIGALNVTRIQFFVYALWNDVNFYYDRAPDSGWYAFDIGPAVTGVSTSLPLHKTPFAGQPWKLSFTATTNIGTPLASGSVQCTANVGGTALTGSGSVANGAGSCVFAIPASAGGQKITAHGDVSFPGASSDGVFNVSATVLGQPTLRFGGVSRARPVAGQLYTLGIAVIVHQPGVADARIQSGTVACSGSAGGRSLHLVRRHVAVGEGVQCTWIVPKTSRGTTLRATVTVHSKGLSARKSIAFRVH